MYVLWGTMCLDFRGHSCYWVKVLYTFSIHLLLNIKFSNILSKSKGVYYLNGIFWTKENFNLIKSNLYFKNCTWHNAGIVSKKSLSISGSQCKIVKVTLEKQLDDA